MSLKRLVAILGCTLMLSGSSYAQYPMPTYRTQYQQQPMMGQVSGQGYAPGYRQNRAPAMQQASAMMRPNQPTMAAPHPSMFAPVYQDPAYAAMPAQAGMPDLAPSMAAPGCGCDAGYNTCGCDMAPADSSYVGQDYFGCGECCDGGCHMACCSDRYFKAFGGWNWLQDFETDFQGDLVRMSTNDGWAIGGAFGRYITDRARRELEFTYRNNTGDSFATPRSSRLLDGVINCYSVMGNLVYELPRLTLAGFTPYIGGGVGVAVVDGEFAGGAVSIDDTAFAYQAFAGVERQLSHRAKLLAEYRYFSTSDVEIEGVFPGEDEYQTNNLFFGLQLSR